MKSKIAYQGSAKAKAQYSELQTLVNRTLLGLPTHRMWYARMRALCYPLLFFVLYLLALQQLHNPFLFILFYAAMGVCVVLIFLNLIHEVVHGNLFQSKKLNNLLQYVFDLIGANSYIWKRRHTILHHNFANVAGWDSDIEQASFFRIFPSDPARPLHKNQHQLMFLVYPFYLANWLLVRDFKDFFKKTQVVRKVTTIPSIEYVKLFVFKLFYVTYIFLVPLWLGFDIWQVIIAILVMLVTANNFALFVLLTPHTNTQNAFPVPDDQNTLTGSWFEHQFITTNDVEGNNWIFRNVMANFNCHLAHHLFPHISYVYAPEVTAVVKEYARSHNLNYRAYPIMHALSFHYQLIKRNAIGSEIFEEDM